MHKITGLAGEMATDRKRVAGASYLGVRADVMASTANGGVDTHVIHTAQWRSRR